MLYLGKDLLLLMFEWPKPLSIFIEPAYKKLTFLLKTSAVFHLMENMSSYSNAGHHGKDVEGIQGLFVGCKPSRSLVAHLGFKIRDFPISFQDDIFP